MRRRPRGRRLGRPPLPAAVRRASKQTGGQLVTSPTQKRTVGRADTGRARNRWTNSTFSSTHTARAALELRLEQTYGPGRAHAEGARNWPPKLVCGGIFNSLELAKKGYKSKPELSHHNASLCTNKSASERLSLVRTSPGPKQKTATALKSDLGQRISPATEKACRDKAMAETTNNKSTERAPPTVAWWRCCDK